MAGAGFCGAEQRIITYQGCEFSVIPFDSFSHIDQLLNLILVGVFHYDKQIFIVNILIVQKSFCRPEPRRGPFGAYLPVPIFALTGFDG